ncbi:50S ribosomal protein L29 [Candidatus Ishikawaella capsulata Mpkobe]|uniref:Large ribosomal subunit protein uL29 n=1 Tax=Candidatus Ishikawaella capsulata Mpkobe TaxID=476281 RepID=C5WCR3_9ENTR|nr:50S ribosomal protein L29 [Candidatus Ishikawaella capsulata Mpkobe]
MKINELRKKNVKDLRKEAIDLLREQFNLRMQSVSTKKIPSHKWKQISRHIARIKTLVIKKNRGKSNDGSKQSATRSRNK